MNNNLKILFFYRSKCAQSKKAFDHLKKLNFEITPIISEKKGEDLSNEFKGWEGDYILCFRSLYIIKNDLLKNTKDYAINFHPGPIDYPGSGSVNLALYKDENMFGVTSHIINEEIDSGRVIDYIKFEINKKDNVTTLLNKTHEILFDLFVKTTNGIAKYGKQYIDEQLKENKNINWSGKANMISEIDALQNINSETTKEELDKIIRATHTKEFPVKIKIHGFNFILDKD